MTDDGSAPTIPDTQAPTHGSSLPAGAPGTPDPRYGLRALLGRGGMGEVWLAHDGRIDREIAIKLMRGTTDPDLVARFLREARVQGRLEHPSVVPVHDLGTAPGSPFFAMKRLTGTTLADVLRSRDETKWPRRTLLARFVDVCLAVEFAHERGVIHRDLKPANIMLGDYGEAYVLDWGLARIAGDSDADVIRGGDLKGESQGGQTEAGAMLGTPGYMSPEQMRGEPVDLRADVFSLGCILFELLAGAPAIPRERTLEVTLASACHRPSVRAQDVPPELDAACAKATAASRDDRQASARALADEVQRFLDGDRDLARRRELSAEHTARARQLLAKDDIESRAEAMHEVGSAIALDAANRDAHAVMMQLLLEPPKTLPPEVRRKIDDDHQRAFTPVMRGLALIYGLAVVLTLVGSRLGAASIWPLALLALENGALAVLLGIGLRRRWHVTPGLFMLGAAMHAAILATAGVSLGPLLVVPLLLFGSLPIMLMAPIVRAPGLVFVVHVLAFSIPFALEELALVPPSFHLTGHALVLEPWALAVSPQTMLFAIVAIVILQLIGLTIVLSGQRREQDRAQQMVHLQSWQFAQLVRSSGSTP
jgi:serine/threonine-protein kinase